MCARLAILSAIPSLQPGFFFFCTRRLMPSLQRTDRQRIVVSHKAYYTTRMLRNAAMPGPLTPRHKCTVYGDDDTLCLSVKIDDRLLGFTTLHESRRYAIPRCLDPSQLTPRHKGTVYGVDDEYAPVISYLILK